MKTLKTALANSIIKFQTPHGKPVVLSLYYFKMQNEILAVENWLVSKDIKYKKSEKKKLLKFDLRYDKTYSRVR